jgi:regulator of sigma E protease
MLILFGIILFLSLVVAHEYGHFLVAKRNDVEVEEFGIGFPPKIIGRELGKGIFKAYYTFNLLPLGGFVRLKGESSADTRKGSFGAATLWVKTKIILAGVVANVIVAFLLFTIVGFIKMPVVLQNQFAISSDTTVLRDDVVVSFVGKDTPAEKAGLSTDDVLLSLDGVSLKKASQVALITEKNAGKPIEIAFKDASTHKKKIVTTELNAKNKDQSGYLGVATQDAVEHRYTWSAPLTAAVFTGQLFIETLVRLGSLVGSLFTGNAASASAEVGGPVLIVFILSKLESVSLVMFLMGTISIALAVFNALPLPALDGGRLAVTAVYQWLKRPLTERTENLIHGTGFAALMLLAVLVTYLDITRIL